MLWLLLMLVLVLMLMMVLLWLIFANIAVVVATTADVSGGHVDINLVILFFQAVTWSSRRKSSPSGNSTRPS